MAQQATQKQLLNLVSSFLMKEPSFSKDDPKAATVLRLVTTTLQ